MTFDGIYEHPVPLQNGEWEGEPLVEGSVARQRVGLVPDTYLTGDFDGDGIDEAMVILWESSGGTGSYTFITVVDGDQHTLARIGDRVKFEGYRFEDGTLQLDVLQAGPDDAMCCPTERLTRRWQYVETSLTEQPAVERDAG